MINYLRNRIVYIKNWAKKNPFVSGPLLAFITWIFLQIFGEIAGGEAYQFYLDNIKGEVINIQAPILILVILFIILVSSLFTILIKGNLEERKKTVVHRTYFSLAEISHEIQFLCEGNIKENIRDFLDKLFKSIIQHFRNEHVFGVGVLVPDSQDSDYLAFWRMNPHRKKSQKRFYIGAQFDKTKERGIAGSVFMSGDAEICNYLDKKNGKTDNPNFFKFQNVIQGGRRTPYTSFICLPICWNNNVIGVLSIESTDMEAFDDDYKIWLEPIADILGVAIYLYNQ